MKQLKMAPDERKAEMAKVGFSARPDAKTLTLAQVFKAVKEHAECRTDPDHIVWVMRVIWECSTNSSR